MNSLVLNSDAISKLKSTATGTEIRDVNGNLIGRFLPVLDPNDVDQFECPVGDDEIQRRAASGGGRPLRGILNGFETNS